MSPRPSTTPADRAGLAARVLPAWPARMRPRSALVIGVLPGEGIGPEVIGASLPLLEVIGARTPYRFEVRTGGKIGLQARHETGRALTDGVAEFCAGIFSAGGAVLCGPGGGRFVYELRERFDLFCKLVPLRPLDALATAGVIRPEARREVDMLVIRENASGLYLGDSGTERSAEGTRAWHRFHYHEHEVTRILRVAVAAARARRGRLCVVTKPAGVPDISDLWERTARELAAGAGVELVVLEVDTACYQIVAEARRFDVIAAPNMFGDVLADGASVLLGSRGVTYSANYSAHGWAVYQTGHGAAHDLAGRGVANPVGQILSLAMMLGETFELPEVAAHILAAINDTLAAGWRTADIMEPGCTAVGTAELGERIAAALDARLAPLRAPARAGLGD